MKYDEFDITIHDPAGTACYVRGHTERGKQFILDIASEEAVFHPNGDLVIHHDDVDTFIEYAGEAGTTTLLISSGREQA